VADLESDLAAAGNVRSVASEAEQVRRVRDALPAVAECRAKIAGLDEEIKRVTGPLYARKLALQEQAAKREQAESFCSSAEIRLTSCRRQAPRIFGGG
jgi:hypothetical protein